MERLEISKLFSSYEELGGKEITVCGWIKTPVSYTHLHPIVPAPFGYPAEPAHRCRKQFSVFAAVVYAFDNFVFRPKSEHPVSYTHLVISGADITARTDGGYGESGVYLTLNLEIQQIVEDCMDECGVDIGACLLYTSFWA